MEQPKENLSRQNMLEEFPKFHTGSLCLYSNHKLFMDKMLCRNEVKNDNCESGSSEGKETGIL